MQKLIDAMNVSKLWDRVEKRIIPEFGDGYKVTDKTIHNYPTKPIDHFIFRPDQQIQLKRAGWDWNLFRQTDNPVKDGILNIISTEDQMVTHILELGEKYLSKQDEKA